MKNRASIASHLTLTTACFLLVLLSSRLSFVHGGFLAGSTSTNTIRRSISSSSISSSNNGEVTASASTSTSTNRTGGSFLSSIKTAVLLRRARGRHPITTIRSFPTMKSSSSLLLQERYAAIPDVGDRAYQILLDLGMVHGNDTDNKMKQRLLFFSNTAALRIRLLFAQLAACFNINMKSSTTLIKKKQQLMALFLGVFIFWSSGFLMLLASSGPAHAAHAQHFDGLSSSSSKDSIEWTIPVHKVHISSSTPITSNNNKFSFNPKSWLQSKEKQAAVSTKATSSNSPTVGRPRSSTMLSLFERKTTPKSISIDKNNVKKKTMSMRNKIIFLTLVAGDVILLAGAFIGKSILTKNRRHGNNNSTIISTTTTAGTIISSIPLLDKVLEKVNEQNATKTVIEFSKNIKEHGIQQAQSSLKHAQSTLKNARNISANVLQDVKKFPIKKQAQNGLKHAQSGLVQARNITANVLHDVVKKFPTKKTVDNNTESSSKTIDDMQDDEMVTAAAPLTPTTDLSADGSSEQKQHQDRKIVKRMLAQIEELQRKAQQKLKTTVTTAASRSEQGVIMQQEQDAVTPSVAVFTPTAPQNIEEEIVVVRHGPAIPAIKKNGTAVGNPSPLVGEKSEMIRSPVGSVHKTFSPLGIGVLGGGLNPKQIDEARQQPKPPKVEAALQERYAAIPDVGDRAYQILLDLGMVGQD